MDVKMDLEFTNLTFSKYLMSISKESRKAVFSNISQVTDFTQAIKKIGCDTRVNLVRLSEEELKSYESIKEHSNDMVSKLYSQNKDEQSKKPTISQDKAHRSVINVDNNKPIQNIVEKKNCFANISKSSSQKERTNLNCKDSSKKEYKSKEQNKISTNKNINKNAKYTKEKKNKTDSESKKKNASVSNRVKLRLFDLFGEDDNLSFLTKSNSNLKNNSTKLKNIDKKVMKFQKRSNVDNEDKKSKLLSKDKSSLKHNLVDKRRISTSKLKLKRGEYKSKKKKLTTKSDINSLPHSTALNNILHDEEKNRAPKRKLSCSENISSEDNSTKNVNRSSSLEKMNKKHSREDSSSNLKNEKSNEHLKSRKERSESREKEDNKTLRRSISSTPLKEKSVNSAEIKSSSISTDVKRKRKSSDEDHKEHLVSHKSSSIKRRKSTCNEETSSSVDSKEENIEKIFKSKDNISSSSKKDNQNNIKRRKTCSLDSKEENMEIRSKSKEIISSCPKNEKTKMSTLDCSTKNKNEIILKMQEKEHNKKIPSIKRSISSSIYENSSHSINSLNSNKRKSVSPPPKPKSTSICNNLIKQKNLDTESNIVATPSPSPKPKNTSLCNNPIKHKNPDCENNFVPTPSPSPKPKTISLCNNPIKQKNPDSENNFVPTPSPSPKPKTTSLCNNPIKQKNPDSENNFVPTPSPPPKPKTTSLCNNPIKQKYPDCENNLVATPSISPKPKNTSLCNNPIKQKNPDCENNFVPTPSPSPKPKTTSLCNNPIKQKNPDCENNLVAIPSISPKLKNTSLCNNLIKQKNHDSENNLVVPPKKVKVTCDGHSTSNIKNIAISKNHSSNNNLNNNYSSVNANSKQILNVSDITSNSVVDLKTSCSVTPEKKDFSSVNRAISKEVSSNDINKKSSIYTSGNDTTPEKNIKEPTNKIKTNILPLPAVKRRLMLPEKSSKKSEILQPSTKKNPYISYGDLLAKMKDSFTSKKPIDSKATCVSKDVPKPSHFDTSTEDEMCSQSSMYNGFYDSVIYIEEKENIANRIIVRRKTITEEETLPKRKPMIRRHSYHYEDSDVFDTSTVKTEDDEALGQLKSDAKENKKNDNDSKIDFESTKDIEDTSKISKTLPEKLDLHSINIDEMFPSNNKQLTKTDTITLQGEISSDSILEVPKNISNDNKDINKCLKMDKIVEDNSAKENLLNSKISTDLDYLDNNETNSKTSNVDNLSKNSEISSSVNNNVDNKGSQNLEAPNSENNVSNNLDKSSNILFLTTESAVCHLNKLFESLLHIYEEYYVITTNMNSMDIYCATRRNAYVVKLYKELIRIKVIHFSSDVFFDMLIKMLTDSFSKQYKMDEIIIIFFINHIVWILFVNFTSPKEEHILFNHLTCYQTFDYFVRKVIYARETSSCPKERYEYLLKFPHYIDSNSIHELMGNSFKLSEILHCEKASNLSNSSDLPLTSKENVAPTRIKHNGIKTTPSTFNEKKATSQTHTDVDICKDINQYKSYLNYNDKTSKAQVVPKITRTSLTSIEVKYDWKQTSNSLPNVQNPESVVSSSTVSQQNTQPAEDVQPKDMLVQESSCNIENNEKESPDVEIVDVYNKINETTPKKIYLKLIDTSLLKITQPQNNNNLENNEAIPHNSVSVPLSNTCNAIEQSSSISKSIVNHQINNFVPSQHSNMVVPSVQTEHTKNIPTDHLQKPTQSISALDPNSTQLHQPVNQLDSNEKINNMQNSSHIPTHLQSIIPNVATKPALSNNPNNFNHNTVTNNDPTTSTSRHNPNPSVPQTTNVISAAEKNINDQRKPMFPSPLSNSANRSHMSWLYTQFLMQEYIRKQMQDHYDKSTYEKQQMYLNELLKSYYQQNINNQPTSDPSSNNSSSRQRSLYNIPTTLTQQQSNNSNVTCQSGNTVKQLLSYDNTSRTVPQQQSNQSSVTNEARNCYRQSPSYPNTSTTISPQQPNMPSVIKQSNKTLSQPPSYYNTSATIAQQQSNETSISNQSKKTVKQSPSYHNIPTIITQQQSNNENVSYQSGTTIKHLSYQNTSTTHPQQQSNLIDQARNSCKQSSPYPDTSTIISPQQSNVPSVTKQSNNASTTNQLKETVMQSPLYHYIATTISQQQSNNPNLIYQSRTTTTVPQQQSISTNQHIQSSTYLNTSTTISPQHSNVPSVAKQSNNTLSQPSSHYNSSATISQQQSHETSTRITNQSKKTVTQSPSYHYTPTTNPQQQSNNPNETYQEKKTKRPHRSHRKSSKTVPQLSNQPSSTNQAKNTCRRTSPYLKTTTSPQKSNVSSVTKHSNNTLGQPVLYYNVNLTNQTCNTFGQSCPYLKTLPTQQSNVSTITKQSNNTLSQTPAYYNTLSTIPHLEAIEPNRAKQLENSVSQSPLYPPRNAFGQFSQYLNTSATITSQQSNNVLSQTPTYYNTLSTIPHNNQESNEPNRTKQLENTVSQPSLYHNTQQQSNETNTIQPSSLHNTATLLPQQQENAVPYLNQSNDALCSYNDVLPPYNHFSKIIPQQSYEMNSVYVQNTERAAENQHTIKWRMKKKLSTSANSDSGNASEDSRNSTPEQQMSFDLICNKCLGPATLLCTGCSTPFCSRQCQELAWPEHMRKCYITID